MNINLFFSCIIKYVMIQCMRKNRKKEDFFEKKYKRLQFR